MTQKTPRDIILEMYPERANRRELVPRINNVGKFLGAIARQPSWLLKYRRKKVITHAQYLAGYRFIDSLPILSLELRECRSSDPHIPIHLWHVLHELLSPIPDLYCRRAVIDVCVFDAQLPENRVELLRIGLRQLAAAWRV